MTRDKALREQARQAVLAQAYALEKHVRGELEFTADNPDCPDLLRLAALTEELGEVARAVHDHDIDALEAELSQLAGVALAWGVAARRTQQLSILSEATSG